MIIIQNIHHVAIICKNYVLSKAFYTEILGFTILAEHYRAEKQSYKLDLALNGRYQIELFSFPEVPNRKSQPEAAGLRHIAFGVSNIAESVAYLNQNNIITQGIRIDEYTHKKFCFFNDPDGLPIEIYEI